MSSAKGLKESAFAPREAFAGKAAGTLARELLQMSQEEFSAMFRKSPMKRARLRRPKQNASLVLGSIGAPDDALMLERAFEYPEPLVREHAAWALTRPGIFR